MIPISMRKREPTERIYQQKSYATVGFKNLTVAKIVIEPSIQIMDS